MRCALLPLLLALSGLAFGQTPTAAVRGFVDAWNRKDLAAAVGLVRGGKPNSKLLNEMAKGSDWPKLSLGDVSETIAGSTATVTATVNMGGPGEMVSHDA